MIKHTTDTGIDLLAPRYKVIADWPSLDEIVIGDIIEGDIFESESLFNTPMNDYPHLFKKLEWWQERKPEEMPEYIKFTDDYIGFKRGQVYATCENWTDDIDDSCDIYFMKDKLSKEEYGNHIAIPGGDWIQPATEEEFLNYLKSKS